MFVGVTGFWLFGFAGPGCGGGVRVLGFRVLGPALSRRSTNSSVF